MYNLLSLNFWFNLRPPALLLVFQQIFIGLVIFLIATALVFWFIKSRSKGPYLKFWRGLYYFSFSNAFVGVVFLFFNYEQVPFLSARFWFLGWGMLMAVWLAFIFKLLVGIPAEKKRLAAAKEYRKYIP